MQNKKYVKFLYEEIKEDRLENETDNSLINTFNTMCKVASMLEKTKKDKMKILLMTLFLYIIPTITYAGPFGTNMGDNVDQYDDLKFLYKDEHSGVVAYETPKIPGGLDEFSRYILSFGPDGLEKIDAQTKMTPEQCKASQLYSTLYDELEEKYGKPSRYYVAVIPVDPFSGPDAKWTIADSKRLDNICFIELQKQLTDDECKIFLTYKYQNSLLENRSKYNKENKKSKYKDKL